MSEFPQFPMPPRQDQRPPKKPRRWPWILGGFLAVVVVSGIASSVAASARTPAPAGAAATKTVVVTETPKTVTVQASPVTKVVTSVVTVSPATTVPAGPATSIDADGVYVVGQDIAAGTWHTTGGSQCYYARLGSTDTSNILDNNIVSGPATVTIGASTKAFDISGGCTWTRE